MSNRVFVLCAVLVGLLLNLYPLYQAVTTGYVFYQNGSDEPGYLNYYMAFEYLSLSRITQIGEYLVVLGHEAGFSGGWINLLLDFISIAAFLLVTRLLFKQAFLDERRANLCSLMVTTFPMVSLTSTKTGTNLFIAYLNSPFLNWIVAANEPNYLPISRTPEPQVSLVVLSLAIWLALRLRSPIPVFVSLPALYSFLAFPTAFVVVALGLRGRFKHFGGHPALAVVSSFILVSGVATVYFRFIVNASMRDALAELRTPLLSVYGSLALMVFLVGYRKMAVEQRYLAALIALAPTAALNQQLISGWIAQPYNSEFYVGVLSLSLVILLAASHNRAMIATLVLLGVAAVGYSQFNPRGAMEFDFNAKTNSKLPLNAEMLDSLRMDSARVVIANRNLASAASLIFPRQPATALAFQRTIGASFVKANFNEYLCTRQAVLSKSRFAADFGDEFAMLDHAFKYQGLDYVLLHLGTKQSFEIKNDPTIVPTGCPPARYTVVSKSGDWERIEYSPD